MRLTRSGLWLAGKGEGPLARSAGSWGEHRCKHPQPVPRSRTERLVIAAERLEQESEADRLANEAYLHYKATGRTSDGRRFGRAPNPYVPPEVPEGKVNVSDPDSHYMKTNDGYVQGYNAQAVVSEQQIVLARRDNDQHGGLVPAGSDDQPSDRRARAGGGE